MNLWIRGIFALALAAGLVYLAKAIRFHIAFTSFQLKSRGFQNESALVVLLSWIWSSVPVALVWCSAAFVAATWGLHLPVARLIAIAIGLLALGSLVAVVIALMWPVRRIS